MPIMAESINRIFIHALEVSSKGTKGVFFEELFPDMVLPTFRGALPERLEKLDRVLSGKTDIRMVGSSFGGLMGTLFTMKYPARVKRLVLLAPAIHVIYDAPAEIRKIDISVTLYHGNQDEVIPIDGVEKVAHEIFEKLSFHAVEDDHFLHRTFKTLDWKSLLA